MSNNGSTTRPRTWRRLTALLVVVLAGVLLTWAVVAAQQGPNIEGEKTGPPFAERNQLITYTIEVTNHGPGDVTAVLSDTIPVGTDFHSCTYIYDYKGAIGAPIPCPDSPPELWTLDLLAEATVRTTLVVRVVGGTLMFPITNWAELTAEDVEVRMGPVTTVLNPVFEEIYLPIVLNNFGQ